MVLKDFDLVTIGVADECGGDGPVRKAFRSRDRLRAGIDAALVEALAVVGAEVELPEGVAVIDGALMIVMPGQLDSVPVLTRQHDLADIGDLHAMGDLEPEYGFVEVNGFFQITDVDAVLIDAGLHCPKTPLVDGFRPGALGRLSRSLV